jgi:3-oxoacyl-[acyl-carrier-protein] synthase-3
MAFLTVNNISIKGMAASVPASFEKNMDYDWISIAEREMLVKTTGIEKRHIASDAICTSDMCMASAEKLISDLKIDKDDIEILIFVSQSPDYFLPATSIILQDKLGLKKTTLAFDIQLGCSGYVYGLSVIGSLMANGKLKKGLLLVGDKSSFSQSKKDKSTYPIFSDAGTATLLEYDENAETMHFNLQSDGSGHQAIIIPDGGVRSPWNKNSDDVVKIEEGIERSRRNLVLDGVEVFNFSIREAPLNVKNLLEKTGTTIDDYEYFIFHQANKLMNETIRKKLKLTPEKVPYSLNEFGNTSSASIPLTIVSQIGEILKDKKSKMVFSAFGVGLSWASMNISLDHIHCPKLIMI